MGKKEGRNGLYFRRQKGKKNRNPKRDIDRGSERAVEKVTHINGLTDWGWPGGEGGTIGGEF